MTTSTDSTVAATPSTTAGLKTVNRIQAVTGMALLPYTVLHLTGHVLAGHTSFGDSYLLAAREVYQNPVAEFAGAACLTLHLACGVYKALAVRKGRLGARAGSLTWFTRGTVTWNRHKVVQTALMAELLDHVTSHATHRSVVADLSRDGRATAMIWVLNWNCRVRMRTAASSRALKVLFRELEDGPDAGRLASDSTGTVVVPDSQPLLELLRAINASLPPSQAQHEIQGEQWKVAYLMQ
ncbi:hypothetical protein AMAG_19118 [Allomyces macrogynus ATCC 38327]|uniref:Uncharacterized protein n=1 Tax=Allomyces macrogynus (strain ATCC 38327) TaxID=578462 RepID=A0A0L0SNP7_ALLM3|nr:hypothetical protein AMAG_19118 [Allomyces macrogynus ATCC 38327]|eukprot:KNE64146.1 hypothetical protein AMAG_19118 [Allomyces macrogynus ATCC 38327]